MKKHTKEGYSIISFYLLLSSIAGFFAIQYFFQPVEIFESKTYLKTYPNIEFEEKTDQGYFENFDSLMKEIENEPIPNIIWPEVYPNYCNFDFILDPNRIEEPAPINMDDVKKMIGYPKVARDAGIEGSVVVRYLVNKKGSYWKHRIINSPNPLLTKTVERHIDQLKFTPAIQEGKPTSYWVNIPFNFKLLN